MALCMMCVMPAVAQLKENPKFGKPTNEEMSMGVYAPDTTAAAVVLYECRDVRYDFLGRELKLFTDVKCRIKVLKDEGKSWANQSVTYIKKSNSNGQREILSKLKACSFNLENGKVVKSKMESGMVSEEKIDDRRLLTKFTVPQVRVGTVIEYEYTLVSDFYFTIAEWKAQRSIPVVCAKYELSTPEYFHFNVNATGLYQMDNSRKSVNSTIMLPGSNTPATLTEYTFVCRNLPALKNEGFMYNPNVYAQKVTAELMSVQLPGQQFHSYTTTWAQADERLMENDWFGDCLNKHVLTDELTSAGVAKLPTAEEKVKAVVKLLRSRVKWNEKLGLGGESASKALKDGSGTNATINFMLINMLRDVGVNAFPVVICTRDDGFMPFTNPSIDALSTVIVGYVDGEKNHYLDASMLQDGYIDVLPGVMLVDRAHEVRADGKGGWLNLQSDLVSSTRQSVLATLEENGELSFVNSNRLTGLIAAQFRKKFREATDSVTFVQEKASSHALEFTDYKLEHHRGFSPEVRETFSCTFQCGVSDGRIYLNPMVIPLLSESPFVADSRTSPIDFPTCEAQVATATVNLPENYIVEELPKPVSIISPDQSMRFTMRTVLQGRQLLTRCTYKISRLFFAAEEYPDVKAMFAEIVKYSTQMVVVKKKSE